ncbi:MAG: cobalt/nickel transport system permease protein [Clostridiales bacterium]|nr:cobalt/nickel transport system permease protein [Clostridiales bacterium]MDK2933701.1 cobalt/nickel transport system permease protein [Clostridiales bacterium]
MHIPDGYIGLETAVPFLGAMIPIWRKALQKIKTTLKRKHIPVLSIGAAFSFTIMMFNVPLPGGSSGHAVGAVLLAILLGPWAACIGVSLALIIQALIFGDGGIWAIGANCFNMAFAMPFIGYYTYKLLKGNAEHFSKRAVFAAAAAGYIGLNAAALLTAVEFGIQPLLFKAADGTPLYAPHPLWVAVPVMMFEHLLIAGPIEGAVTALAYLYIGKTNPELLGVKGQKNIGSQMKEGAAV